MDDDNMIYVYFSQIPLRSPPTNQSINETLGDAVDAFPEIHYYRAILGFMLTIFLYCCLACHAWREDEAEGKPQVIDKSLVRKKVLPHGQSQHFDEKDDIVREKELHKIIHMQCCCCKKDSPDTATAILESYKLRSYRELREAKLKRRLQNEHPELILQDQELICAEEGISNSATDNVCPVCLASFCVGEEVTWSKLQHCRHVFHYECILPWAVLGHVHCPVCREVFWSRHAHADSDCRICVKLSRLAGQNGLGVESALEMSRFCVLHGLISPESIPEGSA